MAALIAAVFTCDGDPLDDWTWRNPTPTHERFQSVAYASGTFVAVGNLGTVFSSPNGTDWTMRNLPGAASEPSDHTLFTVAYGGGRFVALGTGDPFYSADGQLWLRGRSETPASPVSQILGVAYESGLFVAVGREGGIFTSTDGMVWAAHSLPSGSPDLSAVVFGDGRFSAVAQDGRIYTSTDGLAWKLARTTIGPPLYGVAHGNGRWVAVGDLGTILTSTDGLKWNSTPSLPSELLLNVYFFNGRFHAVGGDVAVGREQGLLFASPDGLQWEPEPVDAPYLLTGMADGQGTTVAVGYRGTIHASLDGTVWQPQNSEIARGDLREVIRTRNQFYAVGGYSDSSDQSRFKFIILTSAEGRDWSKVLEGEDARLSGLCEGKGLLVAVGTAAQGDNGEVIMTSSDGVTWSRQDLDPGRPLNGVAFGNGRFVAAGGRTLYSSNGTNWSAAPNGPSYANFVCFTGGKFFADNGSGTLGLRVSNDGINWRPAGLPRGVAGVTWFNGQFIAAGGGEASGVHFSANGTVWRTVVPVVTPTLPLFGDGSERDSIGKITYADGLLVAQGSFLGRLGGGLGSLYSSVDGTNWVRRFNQSSGGIGSVAFGAGTFVAVGGEGIILQSGILPAPPATIDRIVASDVVTLDVSGPVGRDCRVEFSESLGAPSVWTPLKTVMISGSPFVFSDDTAAGQARRYYRTITLP